MRRNTRGMDIVIIGGGTVGAAICMQLATEKHNITVVDRDPGALGEITNVCDVFSVEGNGADVAVLRKAGAEKAELLIAVTSSDEINILCCAAAKKLGTGHTIARVRNPEYSGLMQLMRNEMSLSMTINPELAVAREAYRMLRFPAAAKISALCRGRVEIAEFLVPTDSPICGVTLNDLRARLNIRFVVCGVLRGEQVIIPSGNFSIQADDLICVTVPDEETTRFFAALGARKKPVKNVLIVGGGRITYYLEALLQRARINSTVIEKDPVLCEELAEQYDCTVIHGNGTRQELLEEEGLNRCDAILALSDVDEENAIVSMYARTRGVGKAITLIRAMSYVDFFKGVGLDSIVSPRSSTATHILRFVRSMSGVRGSEIESLHRLLSGQVEALEFLIKENIRGLTGQPLKKLHFRRGVLIACIVHHDKILIPTGDDVISNGDTVIVVTGERVRGIKDILA